jgi:DNA-binding transcriptional regulator GbsR (MarR family)
LQYIRKMRNKANKGLSEAERRFTEDVAQLLVPWGVPQTAARLYGYLLLSAGPAGLDSITAHLGISKSSASVAARLLEQYMLVRRLGERGSKRVLYEVSENYEGIVTAQNRLMETMADLFRAGARSVAPASAGQRLEDMAEFYLMMREAMDAALRRWRQRREA